MRLCFGVIMVLLGGCAASVKINPAARFPLPLSSESPAFLFPINMAHVGARCDPTLLATAVSFGVAAKLGNHIVSGQQLHDAVGTLSFELAESIDVQARANTWTMGGAAEPVALATANVMEQVTQKLIDLKTLERPTRFRYVIALHSHGDPTMGGDALRIITWGGIYDLDTREIVAYTSRVDTLANEEKTLLAELPPIYTAVAEQLTRGGRR